MDKILNSEVIMPQERTDVAVNGETAQAVWEIVEHEGGKLCQILSDGSTVYNFKLIEKVAGMWSLLERNLVICVAKLLLPLRPENNEVREILPADATEDVRISHLCEELEALKEQIRNLSAHKSKLELELATLVSPFKVGDVIKWETSRGRFNSGRVVEIRFLTSTCYRSPAFEWTVSRILKNGSAHRKQCSVFSCQKPVLCTQ